jgi:hypothetical protein
MTMNWDESSAKAGGQARGGLPPAGDSGKVSTVEASYQMMALELENLRLTRLVAELLMKNQQLREKALLV